MKFACIVAMRHVLLFFWLLSLAGKLYAQNIPIDSFFVEGATWTQVVFTTSHTGSSYAYGHNTRAIYYRVGDTLTVNGKRCLSLLIAHGASYEDETYGANPTTYSLNPDGVSAYREIGFIRVDSSRVFVTITDGSMLTEWGRYKLDQEYMLLDFSLQLGDTLRLKDELGKSEGELVSIDTVSELLSDGRPLDIYDYARPVDTTQHFQMMRGIGSYYGLLDYWGMQIGPWISSMSAEQKLLCYDNPRFSYHLVLDEPLKYGLDTNCFDASNIVLVDTGTSPGTSPGTSGGVVADSVFMVFPNPVTGTNLTICLPDTQSAAAIIVYDLLGRRLPVSSPVIKPGNRLLLDLPFPPGQYFLRVELSDQSVFTRRVTKM